MRIPHKWLLLGPALSYAVGFVMNELAIAANRGQMAVLYPGGCSPQAFAEDLVHTCMTHASHLKWLSDWMVINGVGVASLGDLFIWAGYFSWSHLLAAWVALVLYDAQR